MPKLIDPTADLCGLLVDGHDGARQSIRQVAKWKTNTQHPPNLFQERNNMINEMVSTQTDRDANFAHQGWSLSARATTTPWIALRIAKNNQPSVDNYWVTKRIVVQRLAINLSLRDLVPTPEFEEDILVALGKQSKFERFQALDEVFQYW